MKMKITPKQLTIKIKKNNNKMKIKIKKNLDANKN